MKNKNFADEDWRIMMEGEIQEKKMQEMDEVIEIIIDIIDNHNLSPMEINWVLERLKHKLHEGIE